MNRIPAGFAAATAVFGALTVAGYFWPVLAAGMGAFLLLLLLAAAAVGSGRLLALRLGLPGEDEDDVTLVGATVGLGLLSLGTLVLAGLHLLKPWSGALLVGTLWLAGYGELKRACAGLAGWCEALFRDPWTWAAVLPPFGLALWACCVPPHQYDSLVYHLALPQAYLRAGGLARCDWLLYSHFPQNGEMLFTLALVLGSDLLAQMLMWLAAFLCVLWALAEGRRRGYPAVGRLAAVLLATHTAVLLLASTTYVETLVMLWTTAAVFAFLRWQEGQGPGIPGPRGRGWLAVSALGAGLALGTKYNAGIAAGLLGLVLLGRLAVATAPERRTRSVDLAVFVGTVTALFAPWLVKNVLVVGNPVFPFLYRWFPKAGMDTDAARIYFRLLEAYGHGGKLANAVLGTPLLLLGNSLRFGGGMDVLGDLGWEFSFWCLPLGLWAAWREPRWRALAGLALGYLAAWFATGVVLRFLVPAAPLLAMLAAAGLVALWGRLGRAGRIMLAGGAGLLAATHLLLFCYVHAVFGSERVMTGLEDREGFLSRRLDYYPCAAWARGQLGRNDRILIVGEQRSYYCEQAGLATTVNALNRYLAWAEAAASPAAYAARLKAEGFSHVLVVPREAQRLAPALESLSERGQRNWAGLEPDLVTPVFRAPACTLYRLN